MFKTSEIVGSGATECIECHICTLYTVTFFGWLKKLNEGLSHRFILPKVQMPLFSSMRLYRSFVAFHQGEPKKITF